MSSRAKISLLHAEAGIGFFPDVGATFFLPRLPLHAGVYLALTGARMSCGDALTFGVAGAHVPWRARGTRAKADRRRGDRCRDRGESVRHPPRRSPRKARHSITVFPPRPLLPFSPISMTQARPARTSHGPLRRRYAPNRIEPCDCFASDANWL